MESTIDFTFRNQQYSATYAICDKEYPTYIFVSLNDERLVKEFGEEVVLHSDGNALLTENVYSPARLELYTSIFNSLAVLGELKESSSIKR